jgi:thiopurine S-methyltransferase
VDAEFWQARWRNDQSPWHQEGYNEALRSHWRSLTVRDTGRVLVPLCGKSLDMRWLAAQGHQVVGAELSELAVESFFSEAGETPSIDQQEGFRRFRSDHIEIFLGDFFALTPDLVGTVAGVYDRGALVALPADMRRRYAAQLISLCEQDTAILVLSIEYEGPDDLPPFSVSYAELDSLFGATCRIDTFERHTNDLVPPSLAAQGVTEATHGVYRLTVR